MKNEIKLIFIDIDGVLNNVKDRTSYFCYDPSTYGLSPKNLNVLKYILRKTNAKLVLSTSWRKYSYDFAYPYNGMEFKSPLRDFIKIIGENSFYIVSKAPHIHRQTKYSDIMGFFYILKDDMNIDIKDVKFAVLDDQTNQDLHNFKDNFFCIDKSTGLTMNDAESIIFHLNGATDYDN